jgi:hypothetical protein
MKWALPLILSLTSIASAASLKDATWRVRDVAAGSNWIAGGMELELQANSNADQSTCMVIDHSGHERAVTLALCLPLEARGGTWCDDPQRSRKIGSGLFANLSDRAGGLLDSASLYPLAVVVRGDKATCLAVPPDPPRMVRFVYDAGLQELRAEFDFGLSPLAKNFPSRADAKVVTFEVPATWAFRRALHRYYELFPDAFARRVKQAGIWMPFGELGPIKDPKNFGFAFHEIADSQVDPRIFNDDRRAGAGSYIYVEPPSYWQQASGNYDERRKKLEQEAKDGSPSARATVVSGVLRADETRDLYLDPVAYTSLQPWGCDADPDITDPDKSRNWPAKGAYEFGRALAAIKAGASGVYVDSMEGWGELLDYDRDHWRTSQFPLTFDLASKKVALLNFWGTVAWVKKMSDTLHQRGQVLMGNDAFYRRWQMAAYVDVPGREYTWVDKEGKLTPVEEERYLFFRAMSGPKPYLMLMNNRYEDASVMEPYFQRSLFYAVFPSMFQGHAEMNETAYFSNPAWYNRDRALFVKYIPLIRKLDEAGWEPVPLATVDPPEVRIERYGSFEKGNLAFSVHNPAGVEREITLTLMREDLHLPAGVSAQAWLGGHVTADAAQLHLHLPAGGYEVIGVAPPP